MQASNDHLKDIVEVPTAECSLAMTTASSSPNLKDLEDNSCFSHQQAFVPSASVEPYVQDSATVVLSEQSRAVESEGVKITSPWYRKKRYLALIFILLTVAVVSIALGVALSNKKSSGGSDGNDSSDAAAAAKEEEAKARALYYQYLLRVVERASSEQLVSYKESDLVDPTSPQVTALEWMAYQDTNFDPVGRSETALIELYTLLVFYFTTGGETFWDVSGSFAVPGLSHCQWQGIACNNEERVIRLELPQSSLVGNLPAEIGFLEELEIINVIDNRLEGAIPEELYQLTHLRGVLLANNELAGILSQRVSNLIALEVLDLNINLLEGEIPLKELQGLPGLKLLNLSYNSFNSVSLFTEAERAANPELIKWKLQEVLVRGNPLDMTDSAFNLESLLGSFDQVAPYFFGLFMEGLHGSIPGSIHALTKLEYFLARDGNLVGTLPTELGLLDQLEFLQIESEPNLTGPIPSELGQLEDSLQVIKLYSTGLEGDLPSELGRLTNLQALILEFSEGISGELPASFSNLVNLDFFAFRDTQIVGTIPEEMCTNCYATLLGAGGIRCQTNCELECSCCVTAHITCNDGL